MGEDLAKRLRDVADDMAQRAIHWGDRYTLTDAADEIERLRALLKEVSETGLIYWQPNTERGHIAKAEMQARIAAARQEPSHG